MERTFIDDSGRGLVGSRQDAECGSRLGDGHSELDWTAYW
jgi:hypothetical protein